MKHDRPPITTTRSFFYSTIGLSIICIVTSLAACKVFTVSYAWGLLVGFIIALLCWLFVFAWSLLAIWAAVTTRADQVMRYPVEAVVIRDSTGYFIAGIFEGDSKVSHEVGEKITLWARNENLGVWHYDVVKINLGEDRFETYTHEIVKESTDEMLASKLIN